MRTCQTVCTAQPEACVEYFKAEMDASVHHLTSFTWAAANEISWLGLRDMGQEPPLSLLTFLPGPRG